MAIAVNLGGIAFPEARPALRIHRRRQESGKRQTRETVYALTSLDTHQASPADLGGYVRGHWGIENSSHHVRDVVFAEDASTVHTGNAPRAMAALRNLAVGRLRLLGAQDHPSDPERTRTRHLDLGQHRQPAPTGNLKPPCPSAATATREPALRDTLPANRDAAEYLAPRPRRRPSAEVRNSRLDFHRP
ncbi:transposase [Streptomyces kaempferi]